MMFDCVNAAALSKLIAGVVPPDDRIGAVPVTLVTPPAPELLTVTAPVAPDTLIPVPATIDVTPEFVTVGVVVPETLIPVPAVSDCTPVADTLNVVVPLIEIPVPAAMLAAIVGVVVPETEMPLPALID